MQALFDEVNSNRRYAIRFVSYIHPSRRGPAELVEDISGLVGLHDIRIIAVDFGNEAIDPLIPQLYNLLFSRVQFVDSHDIYEDTFDRIPLSLVTHSWFLKNISAAQRLMYDILKRTMDIVIALILGLLSLALFPFLYIAIKLEDGWKIFIHQERIGQNDRVITIIKYRSMSIDDSGEGSTDRASKVTRVGKFIRASRIDELPQLWNVLRGDLSLIGPRPELPRLVRLYEAEIPFYKIRHLIKPGLSGWAQLYDATPPKYGTDYDRTRSKLSYDLYYVKNRSFLLDLHIALKTVKDLLSRRGI
jgi:lipopolysaccharide/colanic/teichoic acid biosynthesis glycosyltransferase